MKRFYLIALVFFSTVLFSQVPQFINYQGVARDASGKPFPGTGITLTISISNSAGSYSEIHNVTTSPLGLFNLLIGNGTSPSSVFSNFTWSASPTNLNVTINAGTGAVSLPPQQMVSVPYALYAEKAGSAPPPIVTYNSGTLTIGTNSVFISPSTSQTLAINGNSLSISGGNTVTLPVGSLYSPGPGISISSSSIITNSAPDQTVVLTPSTNISINSNYPNFTITSTPSLAINGNSLSITGGNTVVIPTSGTIAAVPITSVTGTGAATVTSIGTNSFNVAVAQPSFVSVGSNTVSGVFPTFTITTPSVSANAWGLLGNAGTVDGTNFIGTTDNVALNFRVNNLIAGRIDPNGPTFFGFQSGNSNTDPNTTGFGYKALFANTTGSLNSAFGREALSLNTSGYQNAAFGYQALSNNSTGYNNSAFGFQSLFFNTTGNYNSAFGRFAMRANSTGTNNSAFGDWSLGDNTTGSDNTAMGYWALTYNISGGNNTAFGEFALANNQTGTGNTAVGFGAVNSNTLGFFSTGIGYNALKNNSGGWSIGIGADALYASTTSTGNVTMGNATFSANVTGFDNTGVGHAAGEFNLGSRNVFLGYRAGQNELGSDKLYISNNATGALIYGDFAGAKIGIATTTPVSELDVTGNARLSGSKLFLGNVSGINSGYTGIYENGGDLRLAVFNSSGGATPFGSANTLDAVVIKNTSGNVGIGVSNPAEKLDILGSVKIKDGFEGDGKMLISDNVGKGQWKNSPPAISMPGLNVASVNIGTSYSPLGIGVRTFNKVHPNTEVEIFVHTHISTGAFVGGASFMTYQIRVDGLPSPVSSDDVSFGGGLNERITLKAVFQGLPPGLHTITLEAKTDNGNANGVGVDLGGFNAAIIVKEMF